jgi:hypothetical protein
MPGTRLNWKVKSSGGEYYVSWEVFTNQYNKSYIFCSATNSSAWFQYDGVHFYFTHFEGNRMSLLYSFYQAAFRLPLVNIPGTISEDYLPIHHIFNGWRLFLHDFTAPFFQYLKVGFKTSMKTIGSEFDLDRIEYISDVTAFSAGKKIWKKDFIIKVNGDNSLELIDNFSEVEAKCESY